MSRSRKQPPTRRFAPPSPQVGGIRKMRRPRPLAAAPFLIPPPYGVETSEARSWVAHRERSERCVGWGSVQRAHDALHHPGEIVIDIRIPEPKNPEAVREEKCVAN